VTLGETSSSKLCISSSADIVFPRVIV